ncbi:MAG: hypothetical protein ABR591_10365 [Candidatus Velthaea sp.]
MPFLLIATVIVISIGTIAFARRGTAPDLQISDRVHGTPTPSAERAERPADALQPAQTFTGSGTWTMSSLPSCFVERERTRGTVAALRDKIPPQRDRIRAGTVVRREDCTILVGEHDMWIARGGDRLRVPAESRLYRSGTALILVAISGDRVEIREY